MVAEGDRRMICPGLPDHQLRHTALFLETIWPIERRNGPGWEGERDKAGAELKRERRREERSKGKDGKGVKGKG